MLLHSKLSLFISLSICLSFSMAQNCSNEPFDCGNIAHIAYPFWGGLRTSECGRQGFEIVCNNNIPIINISSLSYQLLKLDFVTNALTVARQDLQGTYCPHPLRNTTIDLDMYKYPPNSTDRNLTLYFDCTAIHPVAELPNAFTCANQTSNLFKIGGDPSSSSPSPSPGIVCDANIYVPVNKEDAESLQNPTPSSINILRSALDAGFSIQWFNDSKQGTEAFCNNNVYGSCRTISYNSGRRCTIENACQRGEGNATSPAPVSHDDSTPVSSPSPSPMPMPPLPTPAPVGNEDRTPVSSPTPTPMPPLPTPAHGPLNGNKHVKKIVIVFPIALAGMILASISIYCFIRRRRLVTDPYTGSKQDVETFVLQQGSLAPKRYKYSEIKKITKSFYDKLGQGGYGSVYKGMLPNGCPVAVKVLFQIDSNGEEFINEVASISRTSHVNIVALLGFCYEGNRRALVYEFMPNSSLDKFMYLNHKQSEYDLDLDKLFQIAVGIAKGLEYLHKGCKTRIVHFDIKPQNILLDEDMCPKISDFGLAKLYKKKQSLLSSMMGTRGTAGYIAPEVFSRNFGEVSHKSDVYSYGMMLLEMAQGRKLDEANQVIQSSESCFPDKIYEEIIRDVTDIIDQEMEGEEEKKRKMLVVGLWCIQTNPSNRPPISRVLEMLEGSLNSIQIPPKPFLFSPNLPHHSA